MSPIEDGYLNGRLKSVVGFFIFAFVFISWGITISTLWGWFIVPLGVVDITVIHGIGLRICVRALTHRMNQEDLDDLTDERWVMTQAYIFMNPWITLAIGYIPHYFMR